MSDMEVAECGWNVDFTKKGSGGERESCICPGFDDHCKLGKGDGERRTPGVCFAGMSCGGTGFKQDRP